MKGIVEEFWFRSAIVYSKLNSHMIRYFGIDKLGFFLGRLKQPRIFKVRGLYFQLNPEVATCFGRMLAGRFNEEETHALLQRLLKHIDTIDLFIDVGANIGEFVIAVAASKNVKRVVGFEPNTVCVSSCLTSARLNNFKKVTMLQKILLDSQKTVSFDLSNQAANAHSIFDAPSQTSEFLETSTLDIEFHDTYVNCIIKIDVEGAELLVLKGGREFVRRNLPFIIFEYNYISKRHFSLEDIQATLPEGYDIFRVRPEDGFLDTDFSETWNCAAVHRDSAFYKIIRNLVK